MTAQAQPVSHSPRTHPPRKLRNYLLEPKFQLKYTSMVVAVTVVVAAVLGYQAYRYSTGQTEMLNIERMQSKGADVDAQSIASMESTRARPIARYAGGARRHRRARARTRRHRRGRDAPVGRSRISPKEMLRDVSAGASRSGRLRKHDELQDIFEAFQEMIVSLRAAQEREIYALLDAGDRESRQNDWATQRSDKR